MEKQLPVLILSGALACAMALPTLAAEQAVPISAPVSAEETVANPGYVLYYGTIQQITRDENGVPTQLRLDSERYGEYVMHLSAETVWIDSGNRVQDDPADLAEGEGVYVFHSAAATLSLPPQSAALAVVRNIPMDAGCAQYHVVEAVSQEGETLTITTDAGTLRLTADGETGCSTYEGGTFTLSQLQAGDRVMAWHRMSTEQEAGTAYAAHLMLLPGEEEGDTESDQVLTRAGLVSMLHEQAGAPVVNYAMQYPDVDQSADYAEAVRWATSEKLVSGYDNGSFGPEDPITREQLAVVLYRYAQSQDQGFTGAWAFPLDYTDAGQVSDYAYEAMCWMTMHEILGDVGDGRLAPRDTVTVEEGSAILTQFMEQLEG